MLVTSLLITNGIKMKSNVELIQINCFTINKVYIVSLLVELLNEINSKISKEVLFVTNQILRIINLRNLPLK